MKCPKCKGELIFNGFREFWGCCNCGRRFENDCGPAEEIDYNEDDECFDCGNEKQYCEC